MDPTNPLGYISGYPSGSPTFSAGWTSNQQPNYYSAFPSWLTGSDTGGMTPTATLPWWQQQQQQSPTPQAQQQPVDTSAPPGNPPQSAADASQQQFNVSPLMGMIPNTGMLGLMGLLGGIPNAAGLSSLAALNQPQGGGGNNANPFARNLSLAGAGMQMLAPRYYNPDTGQWSTGGGGMFGSIAGR